MTVKECYAQMNGNYEDILGRFGNEERIKKYLGKFLNDPNFHALCAALEEKNYENSFLYVHNLKGLCSNLSMTALADSSSGLCEDLRFGKPSGDMARLLDCVKRDYAQTERAIRCLLAEGRTDENPDCR